MACLVKCGVTSQHVFPPLVSKQRTTAFSEVRLEIHYGDYPEKLHPTTVPLTHDLDK